MLEMQLQFKFVCYVWLLFPGLSEPTSIQYTYLPWFSFIISTNNCMCSAFLLLWYYWTGLSRYVIPEPEYFPWSGFHTLTWEGGYLLMHSPTLVPAKAATLHTYAALPPFNYFQVKIW